jgi:hypothetical protein
MRVSLGCSAVLVAALATGIAQAKPARAQDQPPASSDRSANSQAEDASRPSEADSAQSDQNGKKPDDSNTKPDRVFGVLPNYTSVDPSMHAPPITTAEAYRMAAANSFDPYVFPFIGIVTAMGVGQGSGSYLRRYPTALADNTIGNFMTTAVFPSLLHQDPRYFVLSSGGFWHRAAYAASRTAITRSREGHAVFNVSEIGGNFVAADISNAYYPSADRSAINTLTRWGTQVAWDTVANELKEFWPDLRRKFHHEH